jgi:hypothetical protein
MKIKRLSFFLFFSALNCHVIKKSMGGILSLFFHGGELNEENKWKGRAVGTVIGLVLGAIAGSVASDIVVIGSPKITLYGGIAIGGLLGFIYLSDAAGVASQVSQLSFT